MKVESGAGMSHSSMSVKAIWHSMSFQGRQMWWHLGQHGLLKLDLLRHNYDNFIVSDISVLNEGKNCKNIIRLLKRKERMICQH